MALLCTHLPKFGSQCEEPCETTNIKNALETSVILMPDVWSCELTGTVMFCCFRTRDLLLIMFQANLGHCCGHFRLCFECSCSTLLLDVHTTGLKLICSEVNSKPTIAPEKITRTENGINFQKCVMTFRGIGDNENSWRSNRGGIAQNPPQINCTPASVRRFGTLHTKMLRVLSF